MFGQRELEELTLPELSKLAAQVEAAKVVVQKKARAAALKEMQDVAKKHGISLDEISGSGSSLKGKPIPPRYRNPADPTVTWSGRGRQPAWVKEHLENDGDLEALKIENQP